MLAKDILLVETPEIIPLSVVVTLSISELVTRLSDFIVSEVIESSVLLDDAVTVVLVGAISPEMH